MWGRNNKIGIKCKGGIVLERNVRIRIPEKMKEKYTKKNVSSQSVFTVAHLYYSVRKIIHTKHISQSRNDCLILLNFTKTKSKI
jgi:hypothetical protein